jgi:S-adenosylmethionine synthetase
MVLDHVLRQDPEARVACETLIGPGYIVIAGEISADGLDLETFKTDVVALARQRLRAIGYGDEASGFRVDVADIQLRIALQSPEIQAQVIREDGQVGAGDQGLMFGYATNETPERLPLPIALAHRLLRRHAQVRRELLSYLGPDAKSQVTVRYEDDTPVALDTLVLATQHTAAVDLPTLRQDVLKHIIEPCVSPEWSLDDVRVLINHAGSFTHGGPAADTGLTGRKIIVDTYGGHGAHGGGAFSGKDPSKVDRSAAYGSRYIAKNLIAGGAAKRALVQLAYAIGVAEPVSIMVDSYGTGIAADEMLAQCAKELFPTKPAALIQHLDLLQPIYQSTAAYGHFGRPEFTWENTDKADEVRRFFA